MKDILIKYFIVTFGVLLISGCWQRRYDYEYEVMVENATKDTLTFVWGVKTININSPYNYSRFLILPKDTARSWENHFGGFGIDCGTNPVEFFFSRFDNPLDTIVIYRNDSLKALWKYPAYYGSPDDHNFFNYNAWKSWLTSAHEGKIMFTILPEDLKQRDKTR